MIAPPPFRSLIAVAGRVHSEWLNWFQELGDHANRVRVGDGSPENVVTARVGTLYLNRTGGAGTTLFVKESGTGATGWIGK